MSPQDRERINAFLGRWLGSQGHEDSNSKRFFEDLCRALDVELPPPSGSPGSEDYCFEKQVKILLDDGTVSSHPKRIDFFKGGSFLLEAKQGGVEDKGTAKRNTKSYNKAMEGAYRQAIRYARSTDINPKPPFLITCDIGEDFNIWDSFSSDWYGGYGDRENIKLADLGKEDVFLKFKAIFEDPKSLDPSRYQAKVTRDVAETLAKLTAQLEGIAKPI